MAEIIDYSLYTSKCTKIMMARTCLAPRTIRIFPGRRKKVIEKPLTTVLWNQFASSRTAYLWSKEVELTQVQED